MGILDKAKGFAESHRGQVEQGLQKAKEAVNKHAGGGVNPGTAQNPSSPPLSAEPVDVEPTDDVTDVTDETTEEAADETRDTETPIMGVSQPGPGSSGSNIVPPAPPGPNSSGSAIVPPAPPTGPSVGAPAVAPEET